ncbi:cell division protein ZapA [Prevotella sp.]|uniref:cell division protein ZapA n=1 Tax=Prevotella sp. TaxID=59823 RepID=UPI002F944D1B
MSEETKEKLHINLHLYDTDLTVIINREEEKLYRDAGKTINEAVNTYASIFKGQKTDKEILYMALVDIALRYQREHDRNDAQPYNDILDKLTSEIEAALA